MKSVVIYFSQTGNTEKIALAIKAGIKEMTGFCDILTIKDANPRKLNAYDLIGLGSPVWGAEPDNVKIFINNMRFVGGKHIFSFCTHGGISEFYFPNVVPRLKRRGLIVIGMKDWYGDCTLLHHCEPYPTKGHPDDIDQTDARNFGKEMVERSQRIYAGETGLIPPEPTSPRPPEDVEAGGMDIIKRYPSMLKFHKEKCLHPECRLCMDHCPMDGIDLTLEPPVIAKPCACCEFCARICPTGALDISQWLLKLDTVQMMKTLVLPSLEIAEAEGRFRRLLPVEQIDFTLSYKRHKKPPQWIIGKGLQPPIE